MLSYKEKIRTLRSIVYDIECEALESIQDKLEGGGLCHEIGITWNCDKSPIGLCVYDNLEDKAHDDCVFCHQPQERK